MRSSAQFKVVYVDPYDGNHHDMTIEQSYWDALDIELICMDPPCRTEAAIVAAAHDADVVLFTGQYTPFNEKTYAGLEKCLLVQRYGIGMDSVDVEAATRHNIIMGNLALFCVQEVADHTAALLYGLARQVGICDRSLHAGVAWERIRPRMQPLRRMNQLTLGIVGFGQIGRAVAHRMRPAYRRVVAYDPYVDQAQAHELGVEMWDLPSLLQAADFITVHTPLMAGTRNLIGWPELIKMKRTAYLVNTSRGGVIHEESLIAVLRQGRIAGAGLDVFAEEPLPTDHVLRRMDNVLLTPHTAGSSLHSFQEGRHTVGQAVANVLQGYWPPHVFNTEVTPRRPLQPAPAWSAPTI